MSKKVNYEKYNRTMAGVRGINPYKMENCLSRNTSSSQIGYAYDLVDFLEKHGVAAKWVIEAQRHNYRPNTHEMISTLRTLMRDNGLFGETKTEYVNLCKHRETGKKIKYRTTKYCAAPVGYEFIGQISKEVILIEPTGN